MKERDFLVIVDGDPARMNSIRSHFPKAKIMLCLYHSLENIKAKFAPAINGQRRNVSSDLTTPSVTEHVLTNATTDNSSVAGESPSRETIIDNPFVLNNQADVQTNATTDNSSIAGESPSRETIIDNPFVLNNEADNPIRSNKSSLIDLTDMSWQNIWNYIRFAPTKVEALNRLTELGLQFPTLLTYITFLRRVVDTWAVCTFTWNKSYNLRASLSESVFHSVKSRTKSRSVPPQTLPGFLLKVLSMREQMVDRRVHSQYKISDLIQWNKGTGFTELIEMIQIHLTKAGQVIMLESIKDSANYQVEMLGCIADVNETLKLAAYRGASAVRFGCLAEKLFNEFPAQTSANPLSIQFSTYDFPGKFFKTTSPTSFSSIDVVYVHADGSFACTSPYLSVFDQPGKQILACFQRGLVAINPILHCGKIYHVQFPKKSD